ncbi:MAG: biotin-dependent carboxyltransferase family protein [Lachnospiraceae bacterium]
MGILFNKGGMLTTVQDAGRFGFQQFGVSPAGPMDNRAFKIANILVGNSLSESALEVTAVGPEIYFEEANIIAVTGADLTPCINGMEIASYQAIHIGRGDVLSFGGMRNGVRAYIAFAGGLDVPVVMGSKATLIRNNLGGIEGRAIKEGDRIAFSNPKGQLSQIDQRRMVPEQYDKKEIVLRVIPGPQADAFTPKGYRNFFWHGAVISPEFDRMGCRLECEPIEHQGDGNIITDGIAFGAIQIPPSGQPIIMLADRQSTGGYPKIGTVASVDLPLLAQAFPGCKVRFIEVSVETAQLLYNREFNQMKQIQYLFEEGMLQN